MVASKARRSAWMRSAGVSGVDRIIFPTSVALATMRRICRSSSFCASSQDIGTSGSSGWRLSEYCTSGVIFFSGSHSGCIARTTSRLVEWPSTSPRSIASIEAVELG